MKKKINFSEWFLEKISKIETFVGKKILGYEKFLLEFEQKTRNFEAEQKRTLEEIIKDNAGTKWGRDNNFTSLKAEDWKKMPITIYEDISNYIQQILDGNIHALTCEKIDCFAQTSGTTAEPKLIPITKSSFLAQKAGADIWNLRINDAHLEDLTKVLILTGSSKRDKIKDYPIFSFTDLVRKNQHPFVRRRMVFPNELEYISNFEHRLLIAAQQLFIAKPRTLISVNPLTILRMASLIEENRNLIKKFTEERRYFGTKKEIKRKYNINETLNSIEEETPLSSVKLIGTWLGGTQEIFLNKIREKGVKATTRDIGYIATEGRFSIPLEDNTSSGVLSPFGIYYEFLTLDKKEVIPITELKENSEYNIIITTKNGLYRYDMQDIIRVDGFYNSAPIISFRRKDSLFSSIAGEKLHENQVVEAIKKGAGNIEKILLVARSDPPRYVILVEEERKINGEKIDEYLKELNGEYKEKRESKRIGAIETRYLTKENMKNVLDILKQGESHEHDRFKRKYIVSLEEGKKLSKYF